MVFGKVIGEIVCALSPMDEKMTLANPVADPIKPHVHCFGSALFDGVIGYTGGAGIISLDGGGELWVADVA